MNLWMLSYHDEDSGSGWVQEWFPEYTHAAVRYDEVKRLAEEDENSKYSAPMPLRQLTLPRDKAGVAAFLNNWAENG